MCRPSPSRYLAPAAQKKNSCTSLGIHSPGLPTAIQASPFLKNRSVLPAPSTPLPSTLRRAATTSARITLESPNGNNLQELTLKAKDGEHWENSSEHTVQLVLKPQRTPCSIAHVWITLASHNSIGETDDNWNVQRINIAVSNNGVNPQVLGGGSGDPLQRLTGSLPTLVVAGPDCMANTIKSEPATGPIRGLVDLHTHPLSNLAFGG